VIESKRQWLNVAPWETVLAVNQACCQNQNTQHQPNSSGYDAARRLWERSTAERMALRDVLAVCRQCYELSPFAFNNGNTFAAIGKTIVEDLAKSLPPVEAHILRTTVAHYIAGQVGRRELASVLDHFEAKWFAAAPLPANAPSASPITGRPAAQSF
jgi:hypothetical protein